MFFAQRIDKKWAKQTKTKRTYSVPDGVLNGGVGTIGAASTEPGGNVKFNLFFDILLIVCGSPPIFK